MTQQQWMFLAQGLMQRGFSYQQVVAQLGPMPQLSPMGSMLTAGGGLAQLGMESGPYNMQMQAARTGMDPSAIARGIGQLTQKLSPQLINAVTRAIAPKIAGSGVASAPGMSTQMVAEALAPYQLQEQQLGQQAFFAGQDMPFHVGAGLAGQYPSDVFDYTQLLAGMMRNP